jgi:hypothetical protein
VAADPTPFVAVKVTGNDPVIPVAVPEIVAATGTTPGERKPYRQGAVLRDRSESAIPVV